MHSNRIAKNKLEVLIVRKISKEELTNDIIKTCKKYNDYSLQNYKEHGSFCPDLLYKNFGFGWKQVMKELNLPCNGKARMISKEELTNDVLNVFRKTNNTKQKNYIKNGNYSRSTIKRIYGSWNKMLISLGYEVNMTKPGQYTKEDLMNAYYNLKEKLGHCPTAYEYRLQSGFSEIVLHNLFDSYSDFLYYVNDKEAKHDYRSLYSKDDIILKCKELYNENGFLSKDILNENFYITPQAITYHFGNMENLYKVCGLEYNMKHSKSMLFIACFNIIKKLIGDDCIFEKSFNWLINPMTNRKLFVDIYYPKLKLAIEIDGAQHYKETPFFKETLEYRQYKDNKKDELLKENNINIIRIIKPNYKYIKEKLYKYLKN